MRSVGLALLQRAGLGVGVLLPPDEAVLVDLDGHPGGEGVDHGDADAVQTAGDRVRLAVELAARVQHGQRDLDTRLLQLGVQVDREATAVVGDPDAAVGEQHHVDGVAVAGQRLVDRVVDDLPHQVVQTALAGRADVHAGPLADRLQPFEDGDRLGAVLLLVLRCHPRPLSRAVRAGRAGRGFGGQDATSARTDRHRRIPPVADGAPVAAVARGSRSARTRPGTLIAGRWARVRRSASGLRLAVNLTVRETTEPPLGTPLKAAETSVAGRTALARDSPYTPAARPPVPAAAANRAAGPTGSTGTPPGVAPESGRAVAFGGAPPERAAS